MPHAFKTAFFRALMAFLKLATWVLNFRKPELFSGPGSSLQLCDHIAAQGVKNLLLVTDAMLVKIGLVEPLRQRLVERGVGVTVYDGVQPDPTIQQIETGLDLLKKSGSTAILAIGGGSSIDAAKVIATRARNGYPIAWMAGLMRVLRRPLPLYAVPTTAGTGSEVTIAAVVSDPASTRKFAIMDPKLVPVAAALDGALMTGLPPAITAATGMDALTHAVEAYISRNAMARTDAEALEATRLIMENLPKVMKNGQDLEARQAMALASFKAGVAFTSAGVGYVHAISHNLGAYYHVPHGLANAIVLPQVLDYSLPACTERLATLATVSGLARGGETPRQLAERFVAHVRSLNAEFGIPATVQKLREADIPAIIRAALSEAHWTYAVPRYLDRDSCEALVRRLLPA
ncbi:MAG TPA: iron-containing alcohol dehydrogenase [Nevskiaceae bacterium]|nr:iron-containing alcohol dehydrogenase [Nevskiaceae bacterium]